jgi:hypothetical protein
MRRIGYISPELEERNYYNLIYIKNNKLMAAKSAGRLGNASRGGDIVKLPLEIPSKVFIILSGIFHTRKCMQVGSKIAA